jgi:hypothetical protein
MSTEKRLCETCFYYMDVGLYPKGECRQHAPIANLENPFAEGRWPIVHLTSWCGDYKGK